LSDNIWVSFRHPDGRTFTIGGSDPDKFFDNATGMLGNAETAQRLMEDFQVLADPPVAQAVANAAPLRASTSTTSSPSPARAPAPPVPGGPACDHGARIFRSGRKKDGSNWNAWFCPQPKGQPQCDVEWA
jgi:hypothetical protein